MFKKIIYSLLILIFSFVINSEVFGESLIPVEDVFLDINKDYKYYHELQTLYDKGIIEPEIDNKFHPDKLLNRDEFVGIAEETSCKKCISPNVDFEFLDKFKEKPFFDVGLNNKYFYCISDAKEKEFVLGYDIGDKCNNGVQKDFESPFCTYNNIKLEEALAVVMRMGGILTDKQAEEVITNIKNGKSYPDLAIDLKPLDGNSPNSFYPYFAKALEYKVIDYDNLGNKTIYKLVEKKGNYLRPDGLITKQDFLKMAYIALKANSCIDIQENNLAIEVKIFDKNCSLEKEKAGECSLSDFKDEENIFDFTGDIGGICEKGIDKINGYKWIFYNITTGKQIIKYGEYIDNYKFLEPGNYKIILRIIDNCGNTGEVYNSISITGESEKGLGLDVIADKVYGELPLKVSFDLIVDGGIGPYKCIWDYGDGTKGNGEDTNHTFDDEGTYKVITTCTDSNGLDAEVTTVIKVVENINDDSSGLGLDVKADKIYGKGPLDVIFDGTVKGGDGVYECNWDYGDGETGEGEDTGHKFENAGIYKVITTCTDSSGSDAEVITVIKVVDIFLDLSVSINASEIIGDRPFFVNFEALVNGGIGPYQYIWDFNDGDIGNGKNVTHIFTEEGFYNIELIVIDSKGSIVKATTSINVLLDKCERDADSDGINDCDDKCIFIKGVTENDGCPIFIEPKVKDPIDLGTCLNNQKNTGFIFGNVKCSSCPCELSIDFRANLRICDNIIPAITSVNEEDIFARGKIFQVIE